MLRLLFTLFLIVVASVLYSYIHDLNPGSINIRLSPSATFELSPVSLMLVSMAIGALIVILFVGVRETRDLILTWRSDRLRRREEKVERFHREGAHASVSKRTAEAISLFHKALTLDPNHVDSLLWLGNIHRAEQNYSEAIRLHRKARGIEESNIEVLLALAQDLEGAKRFEEALQTLRDVLRFDQANMTALIRQRELYIRLEHWSEALEVQHRMMKAHLPEPDQRTEAGMLVGMTYEVGRQLLERGHPEKAPRRDTRRIAGRYFHGAIKRDKTFLPAYVGLGEILVREGKTKTAGEILEKVYAKTGNVIILHRLEELYLEMGEPSEIIRVYQEACQRHPHNAVLKFYLGKLYYRLEMIDEAYDLLSTLEASHDRLSDYHKIMANLYLRKQQMEEAVEELKKALGFRKRVIVPYACTHCRRESLEWAGRCRHCGLWNTYVALPWVDASESVPQASSDGAGVRSIPYQGIASPFETV
ncbi:MAG: tetratricopeptide repeat protein [Nitrospiraceae bacterium]|nr:tetratricopeptide repeat protein [Nitrospiraceae bacterium]